MVLMHMCVSNTINYRLRITWRYKTRNPKRFDHYLGCIHYYKASNQTVCKERAPKAQFTPKTSKNLYIGCLLNIVLNLIAPLQPFSSHRIQRTDVCCVGDSRNKIEKSKDILLEIMVIYLFDLSISNSWYAQCRFYIEDTSIS